MRFSVLEHVNYKLGIFLLRHDYLLPSWLRRIFAISAVNILI